MVNDSMEEITNAKIIDTLGDHLEFVEEGFSVERIIRNYKNQEISREVVTDKTPVPTENGFELELGSITDAYEIKYRTQLIRPEGGGVHELSNKAIIDLDGDKTNVEENIKIDWSEDIATMTKKGVVSDDRQDVINWVVDYNFGKQDLGNVTLTDTLTKGEVIESPIKIQQVDTDINGNVIGIINENVDIIPTIDGQEMIISELDAAGKAYRITFSSIVPAGFEGTVTNTVSDDVKGSMPAVEDVDVNTIPTGGKIGEQLINKDNGRPYIEWTITLNTQKVDINSITILDLFNGDYLEFDVEDESLYKMSSEGEAKTNFEIIEHIPEEGAEDQRVGFQLTIDNAGPAEYEFVYRTYYTPEGMKQPHVANEADILFLPPGGGDGIGEATIRPELEVTGPQPGIQKSARYIPLKDSQGNIDISTQEIEWTITFNESNILLNAGSQIVDDFIIGNYEFVEDSLDITLSGGYDFVVNDDNRGFVLTLTEETRETVTLTYRTTTDDLENKAYDNAAKLTWNGQDQVTNYPLKERTPGLHKEGHVVINEDGTKQIDWTIQFNNNRNVIPEFVLRDTNQPSDSKIESIRVKKDGKLLSAEDYNLTGPSDNGEFMIEFDQLDAVPYEVTYSSILTAAQEKELIRNDVNIEFLNGTDQTGYTIPSPKLLVEKSVVGNEVDKTNDTDIITWKVVANRLRSETLNGQVHRNFIVNLTDAKLIDNIPEDQRLVPGTVKVFRADDPNVVVAENKIHVNEVNNSFTVDLPDGPYEWHATFQTEIVRYPSVHPAGPYIYGNDVILENADMKDTDDAQIGYYANGEGNPLTKSGIFNDDTENVDWNLTVNPDGLKISNPIIKDTLDPDKPNGPDHYYVTDSFVLSDDTGQILDESLYTIEFPEDSHSFSLSFTARKISSPINIAYSTRVRDDFIGSYNLTNTVEFYGGDRDKRMNNHYANTTGTQWFYGGGGSGRVLTFTLNKENKYEEAIENAKFNLTRVATNGDKIALDEVVTTDENGVFQFNGVRAGRYIIEEIDTPEAYQLLENPIHIMVGYASSAEIEAGAEEYIVRVADENWVETTDSSVAKADGNALTIINQFKTGTVSATKKWVNTPLNEVQEVYLQLYRQITGQDGVKVPGADPINVTTGGTSVVNIEWPDIEMFTADGIRYEFYVEEVDKEGNRLELEGYTKQYGLKENGLEQDRLTIINTNIETVNLKGTKTWEDYKNAHGTRPSSIKIEVWRSVGNEAPQKHTESLFSGDGEEWTYQFDNLPKYNSQGEAYNYSIKELVHGDYTVTYEEGTYNLKNTYVNTETLPIKGQKVWNDYDNAEGHRPESIRVILYSEVDGSEKEQVSSQIVDADTNWQYDFGEVAKYDADGKLYSYSIEEQEVEAGDLAAYTSVISETSLITNTLKDEPIVSVAGVKTWEDFEKYGVTGKQLHDRPSSVTVKLLQDGREINRVTTNEAAEWKYQFANLPRYKDKEKSDEYNYTISEESVNGYRSSIDANYNLTNTYINNEKTTVSVRKEWQDYNNRFNTRPEPLQVEVQLMLGTEPVEGQAPVVLNEANNWERQFVDLPKYDHEGRLYDYTVQEINTEESVYEVDYIKVNGGYIVRNTYVNEEKISVTMNKEWDDWTQYENGENQHNLRPTSVLFTLYQNDEPYRDAAGDIVTAELTDAIDRVWEYTISDLPKYDAEGNQYKYSAKELDVPKGYRASEDGLTVKNTYINDETVKVDGTKVWNDYSNKFGTRPKDGILVYLLRDGVRTQENVLVQGDNSDNEWSFSFDNLPKYNDQGEEYTYTFDELTPHPYTKSIDETGQVITNSYVNSDKISRINGEKQWFDYSDKYDLRPSEITIHLLQNGKDYQEKTVKPNLFGRWRYEFENLPQYNEDDGEEYTYTIVDRTPGYEVIPEVGYDITNKLITTNITGEKEWDDFEDTFGLRPDSITVHLLQNEEDFQTLKVKAAKDGTWSYSFDDVPKFDADGNEFVYTITEDPIHAYEADIQGYDVKNTLQMVEVAGEKVWSDFDNDYELRPDSITVNLSQNEEPFRSLKVEAATDGTWSYSFGEVPEFDADGNKYSYVVTEDPIPAYSTNIEGYEITNTLQTVDVTGEKVWSDFENEFGLRPDAITVHLLQNGNDFKTLEVKAAENGTWSYSFENVPEYDAHGEAFVYTVTEDAIPGYSTGIKGSIITNTLQTVNISGEKVWEDTENTFGLRPDAITVHLLQNDKDFKTLEVKAAEDGTWSYSFDNVPEYDANGNRFVYTVSEDAIPGYTTNIAGHKITNTLQRINVTGEKVWVDDSNKFDLRPESITVNLLRNGAEFKSTEIVSEDDGTWSYSFIGMPEFDTNGERFVYTVTEDEVHAYDTTIEGSSIINTLITRDVSGQKNWTDFEDTYGLRPDSITVNLLRNSKPFKTLEVKAGDEGTWAYIFEGVPAIDTHGEAFVYTVTEDAIPGYSTKIEGNTITNTLQTVNVSGEKVWSDFENEFGLRPDSITVHLLQNDKDFKTLEVKATKEGTWSYSFDNVPKYDANGEAFVYTVTEDTTPGYRTEIDGTTITNTLQTVNVSGEKAWSDFDNEFGLRPDAITVHLLQNDKDFKTLEVKAGKEGKWNYSFNNIPKFDENGDEFDYTVTEDAINGYTTEIDGTTITNTLQTVEVSGEKEWNDLDNKFGLRPDSITVHLLQNTEDFRTLEVEPTEDGTWSFSFEEVPEYDAEGKAYHYTLAEETNAAYTPVIDNENYLITNNLKQTELEVSKVWADNEDEFGLRPKEIVVRLNQGQEGSKETTELAVQTVTEADDWTFNFTNLPLVNAEGVNYVYTVTEDTIPDYKTEIKGGIITNTLQTVNISGEKVWEDTENTFGLRPDSITVHLLQNDKDFKTLEVKAAKDGTWSYSFGNVPEFNANGEKYVYTVTEDPIPGYTTTIEGHTITNTLQTIDVAGEKEWIDYNNKFGLRPDSITVRLLQNAKEFKSLEVKEINGSWKYSFVGVPKVDANGKAYDYTVTEDAVEHYDEPIISGTHITNIYINREVIQVSGEKQWDDFDNRLGSRPESITLILLQNGVAYLEPQVVTADHANRWLYGFIGLLKYDEHGELYTYSIEELAVDRYKPEYDAEGNIINRLIPDISVSVGDYVWLDTNEDGLQDDTDTPLAQIVLTIEKEDGTPVTDIEGLPVEPQTTDENGKYSFDKLPADATYIVRIDREASAEVLKDYAP